MNRINVANPSPAERASNCARFPYLSIILPNKGIINDENKNGILMYKVTF